MKTPNRTPLSLALGCAMIGWIGCSQHALAQAAATGTQAADANARVSQLDTLVVTAQSRSQEMQKVPIALQVVDAKKIDALAATDLGQMALFVPGLQINSDQPTQPIYKLRGISTDNFSIGTDPAVGVYVDGVYTGRAGASLMAFNDIQRVEVLKGPQGTLFGRNAAAGAISIVTNEPGDDFDGNVRLRAGNYGKRYGDALVNLPITDSSALRVSVYDNQSDGWLQDAATGKHYKKDDDWGARASWRWNVTPDTKVLLSWEHSRLDQPSRPAVSLLPLSGDPGGSASYPPDPATYVNPLHAPLYNDAFNDGESRTYNSATLNITHDFSWGQFKSTTSWHEFDNYNAGDYDGTNYVADHFDTVNIESNRNIYQEFKFSGNSDLLDWVAGASYYRENAHQDNEVVTNTDTIDSLLGHSLGIAPPLTDLDAVLEAFQLPYSLRGHAWTESIRNKLDYTSEAAYGDVIWHLTDRLNLTTGLRFTRDQKDFSWYNAPRQSDGLDATLAGLGSLGLLGLLPDDVQQLLAAVQSNLIFPNEAGIPVSASNTWSKWSPRVVLDYALTPDSMIYASYAKGYKAGGYDSTSIGSLLQPEDVTNYEVGYKASFPNHHLSLATSAYYYRYDNIQSLVAVDEAYKTQATNQQAYGLDVDLQWRPVRALELGVSAGYIDSTYRGDNSIHTDFGDYAVGGEPSGEPKLSYTANLAYTWSNVLDGNVRFTLSHAYRGRARCNSASAALGRCDVSVNVPIEAAQQQTDARLDWNATSGGWGVGMYVNNVFDKRYVTYVDYITLTALGTPYAYISAPRLWGAELRVHF